MDKTNRIINGLWVGNRLSPVELLTLFSFTEQGHIFHLWIYEELENILPPGVILKDANEIIPFANVFSKKEADLKIGIGKGSFGAPFSDLFRYKLLYEKGGWWVDMDVTCFKPLDYKDEYFFRSHPILPMIGNVMKCPQGCELMHHVYEEVNERCDENTTEWLLPNKILNKHIERLYLESYIQKYTSNNDDWLEIEGLIYADEKPLENWSYIHWMNEEWRTRNLDKNIFFKDSYLQNLFNKYEIPISIERDYHRKYIYRMRQYYRNLKAVIKKILFHKNRI